MRIAVSDLARPKAAAKLILKLSGKDRLSGVQESLASAMGYRDWYDLSRSRADSTEIGTELIQEARDLILRIADTFGMPDGDAQYAVTRTRLVRDLGWTLEQQIALRCAVWRARCGPQGRGRVATVVKVRARGETRHAYLVQAGRPTHLLYDQSPGIAADFEVVTPRVPLSDFVPKFLWLPYGYWTLRDGSEVAFGREYQPLWRVIGEEIHRLDPWQWIEDIHSQHWFMNGDTVLWSRGVACERALDYLRTRRISGLPRLVDAMPFFFDPAVGTVDDAVELLQAQLEPVAAN